MSNPNAPFGFEPVRGCLETRPYLVDASNSRALGRGDLVELEADGNCTRADGVGGTPSTRIVGSFSFCEYNDSYGVRQRATYLAASKAADIKVYDDPGVMYRAMGEAAAAVVATDKGANCEINDVAPSEVAEWIGHSNQTLDLGTLAATAAQIRLWMPYPAEDNLVGSTATGANGSQYGIWLCQIAEHFNRLLSAAGGQAVGVTS